MVAKIMSLFTFLEGKKSTWLALISLIAVIGNILGFITPDQTQQLLAICGAGYAGTMAEKVNRLIGMMKEQKVVPPVPQP